MRLAASCFSMSSGDNSSKKPATKLPALLTKTSMRPNRSTAAREAASASARRVTSSLTISRSLDLAHGLLDRLGVPTRGDNGMASGQSRLRDIDTHPTAGAGDKPNFLSGRPRVLFPLLHHGTSTGMK